jgi:hypothetical protein
MALPLLALLLAGFVQDEKPYKPMGAPADPKVSVQWNRYHDYGDATKILRELAAKHPKRCRLQSLGKSYGKRDMWILTITEGTPETKPAFYIDGGIHANELQGPEVVLYTAWYLLEMYGRNDFITRLLRERVFYLVPMLSPDSRDAHMHKPNTTHSPRSGQRPIDDDRDGIADEDGPDDLDGDGNITQMRVRDPHGKWKRHREFPNFLVRIEEGEKGEYSILGAEGIDNDGDGRINEDGDGYYDPNRDWAWNWQPAYVQGGAYRYPFSIEENRMVADFILAHPNISGAQSYHNSGGMILRGPGAKDDRYDSADLHVYDELGKKAELMLPGYKYMNVAEDLYEVYGGELDWIYAMRGAFTFTNELFTPFNLFRKETEGGWFGKKEDLHRFNKYLLFEEGTVPWKEVDHPFYGKIEVGGLKKNWMRQPPSFLLEEECHRNMAFTLYHADQMPLVKVLSIDTRDLGSGLTEVTAVIGNDRLTPTHAAVDVRKKITPPDRATLSGKDLRVIAALTSPDRFFRSPTEQKRTPAEILLPNIPGRSVRYLRWIVRGEGPFTVTLRSIKGGTHSRP